MIRRTWLAWRQYQTPSLPDVARRPTRFRRGAVKSKFLAGMIRRINDPPRTVELRFGSAERKGLRNDQRESGAQGGEGERLHGLQRSAEEGAGTFYEAVQRF